MKRLAVISLICSMLVACSSSGNKTAGDSSQQATNTEKKNVPNIKRKRIAVVRDFEHITNIGTVDIVFTHGDYGIEVEGDSALLDMVRTEFDSNLLTVSIGADANPDYGKYNTASSTKLYISAPLLKCLTICNAGGFTCIDDWKCDDIQIGMFGSGIVKLGNVECKKFLVDSSGNGSVSVGHLKADVATLASRMEGSFTFDCDVEDFVITNGGKQKIKLTGKIAHKEIYKADDPLLTDLTE